MKWLYSLVVVFVLIFDCKAQTNVISVNVGDYGLQPLSNRVTLNLIYPNPRIYNNTLISQAPISITTSNGLGYFTNIIWGQYRVDVDTVPVTKFLINVNTNSTGNISLASLVTGPEVFPTQTTNSYYTNYFQTNVIMVNIADYGLAPQSMKITLTLITPNPRTYNNYLISSTPISTTTGTNGIGYFTNLIWGQYRADLASVPVTKFMINVNTNSLGSVSFVSLVTDTGTLPPNPSTNYYNQAQIDSLLSAIRAGVGITNGYATNIAGVYVTNQSIYISTNYATTNYVLSQGFVTSSITNGLATTNYVNNATNGLVTASITNGLATTNYVKAATNGLPSGIWTLGTASQSNSTAFAPSTVTNLTSGQIATIEAAITNGDYPGTAATFTRNSNGRLMIISPREVTITDTNDTFGRASFYLDSGVNYAGKLDLFSSNGTVVLNSRYGSGDFSGTVTSSNIIANGTIYATNSSQTIKAKLDYSGLTLDKSDDAFSFVANPYGMTFYSDNLGGNPSLTYDNTSGNGLLTLAGTINAVYGEFTSSYLNGYTGSAILGIIGNGVDNTLEADYPHFIVGADHGVTANGASFNADNTTVFSSNVYFAENIYVTNHSYDASGSLLDPEANEYVTATFVRSVLNNGAFLYGTTNTTTVGFSNILTASTNKVSLQFGANAPGYTKGFTNFVTGTYPNGPYFASIVSTNTYQSVTGPFVNDFYIQADGSGAGHAISIAPDIFVSYDLTNLIPICSSSGQALTMAATTNLYTWIQSAAQYNSTNAAGFYVVRRVRVTSQNGNNLYINVKGGSGTATTLAFSTPVTINANYVGTFIGNGSGLTNIIATNITGLGTAAYSNSTAFALSTVTNLTATQISQINSAITNAPSTLIWTNGNGIYGNGIGITNLPLTALQSAPLTNNPSVLKWTNNAGIYGNGVGITNVTATLPSGVSLFAIGSLTLTNAITIKTNSTIPTLVQNVNTTCIPSSFIDPSSNDGLIILSYLAAAGTTMPANSNYFTITLSQPATSTNSLIVIATANATQPIVGQTLAANTTLNRYNIFASSNSFVMASGTSVPPTGITNQLIYLQVYRR